jgi:hypothetical protein
LLLTFRPAFALSPKVCASPPFFAAYPAARRLMNKHFHRLFAHDNPLGHLQDHAARLVRLQQVLEAGIPAQLARACRVANLKNDTLIVSVRGSAMAVRLKQGLPSLEQHFALAGYPLVRIKIKVALPEEEAPQAPRPAPERVISAPAREEIERFAASLPEDAAALRAALERLARRSREG